MRDPYIDRIREAIATKKGLLIAGKTGSGKNSVLSSVVAYSEPDSPRFIFTGELFVNSHASAMLREIHKQGIPLAMSIQSESKEEAWDRVSEITGMPLEQVKEMFPVVIGMIPRNVLC